MLLLCSILVGCDKRSQEDKCQYFLAVKSELVDYLKTEYTENYLSIMNGNTVNVIGQSVVIDDYQILLEEYFYEKNTPSAIYQFSVLNQDGTNLSDDQYNQFVKIYENGTISILNDNFNSSVVVDKVIKNENGKIVWIVGMLLSAITTETQITQIEHSADMTYLDILYDSHPDQRIKVPDYCYNDKVIKFHVEESEEIALLKINSLGICVVKDLTNVLADFEDMIENLPKEEDPETYGYEVFNHISVVLNDGSEYGVYGKNQSAIMMDNIHICEENKLVSYTAFWNEKIDIEDIQFIIVDGVKYVK